MLHMSLNRLNRWTRIAMGATVACVLVVGSHRVLRAAFGTPAVFTQTTDQTNAEGDAVGIIANASVPAGATVTYTATAVNQVTGALGLPAGLSAANTND